MCVIETAALSYGAYRYIKHRKHKKGDVASAITTIVTSTSKPSIASSQPLSNSTTTLASTQQPPADEKRVDSLPDVPILPKPSSIESETGWRSVYMLERSISKDSVNEFRTHRALFVGEFVGNQRVGKTHEIRKEKSSILGVLPFNRTARYTDAEEWVGDNAFDRPPVLLGYTDWTDEELNREGNRMMDDCPTYSLNYANCHHFIADLAVKIMPEEKMDRDGMRSTQPAFDRMTQQIEAGELTGHSAVITTLVADLLLGDARQKAKFFHFTTATYKSMTKRSWQPFDEYSRLLKAEHLRTIAAHAREYQMLGAQYIPGRMSGNSSACGSTQRLGVVE
ncbi:hypothetical protein FKW77_007225 [Venturia effusa]|uniref:Uncharacterized protein n=1 Tax=Venturia effusa TaxID=50376 RepID=A0A517LE31_9PEZI|nr:hypothetical protein FKW77_007225 [Venturia effusa]